MADVAFLQAIPVLPALDLDGDVAYYQYRLGFTVDFRAEGYVGLSRDQIRLHLWQCGDPAIAQNSGCQIRVRGIAELFAEYQAHQVIHPDGQLEEKPWGDREFTAIDGSGNCLTFVEGPAV